MILPANDETDYLDKDILGLEIPVGDRWFQTLALVGSKLTWFMKGWFVAGKWSKQGLAAGK